MCTVRTFIKFNQQKVSLFSFRHLIKRTKTETNELHITSNCQDFNNSLAGTFCICLTNIWATNSKFLPISDCSRAVRCWSFDLEHLSLLSSRKHRESSVPLCSGSWAWVIGVLLLLRCCNRILLSTRTRTLVFLFWPRSGEMGCNAHIFEKVLSIHLLVFPFSHSLNTSKTPSKMGGVCPQLWFYLG